VTYLLVALLVVAASLESVLAVCRGCVADRFLAECEDCDEISDRLRTALASNVLARR